MKFRCDGCGKGAPVLFQGIVTMSSGMALALKHGQAGPLGDVCVHCIDSMRDLAERMNSARQFEQKNEAEVTK